MDRPRVRGLALLVYVAILGGAGGAVASADEDPTAAWLRRLNGASRETKIDTLELLGTSGQAGPDVLVQLEKLLRDSDPEVVATAAAAFLSLGGDRAIHRSQLRNAKPAVQIGLARVLLGADESDKQALNVLLDLTPKDWSTVFTLSRFSPSLSNRMVDEVLARLEALDPAAPLGKDSAGLVYFSLIGFSQGFEPKQTLPLLSLSRTGPSPLDEFATWILVRDFGREPKVAAALREDLERSSGPRQATVAIGILLNEPHHAKAWQMLRLAMNDPDEVRVSKTAETIGELKLSAAPLLPQLLNGLTARDRLIRRTFIEPIVLIGPAAVPDIVGFLDQKPEEAPLPEAAWEQVHEILQRIGSDADAGVALPIVIARVRQGDQEAITTLCSIGRKVPLVEIYADILEHGEDDARRTLVTALFRSPPTHEETRAMLRSRLPDATRLFNGDALLNALWLRLTLGADPAEISGQLTTALQTSSPGRGSRIPLNKLLEDLNSHVAEANVRVPEKWQRYLSAKYARLLVADPPTRSAVPKLIERLRIDSLPKELGMAPSVVERADEKESAPDPEPDWRRAASALGKIGPSARDAIGPLMERLGDPYPHSASYVLGALSEIVGPNDQEIIPTVRPFLRHDRVHVHARALSVLVRIAPDDPATVEDVRSFLKRCRLRQRSVPMLMAEEMMLQDAFAHLTQSSKLSDAVRTDLLSFLSSTLVDPQSRCEVAAILCRFNPPDPIARRHLHAWAASESHHWNDEARHTLSRLGEERENVPSVR